jgi:integrase
LIRFNFIASVTAVVSLDETTALIYMAGRQAKILSSDDFCDLLAFASFTRNPLRNRVIVLLSAKAGLRAGEIAKLTWDMLVDGNGRLGDLIELRDCAAKKASGRRIPIHPDLAAALVEWRQAAGTSDHVIRSERGGPMTPLGIVVWFNRAFNNIGLKGCSSHSGRRTFVTRAARAAHAAGGSLRDVQILAGHRSIQTTQRYIDGDSDAQRKLVSMI